MIRTALFASLLVALSAPLSARASEAQPATPATSATAITTGYGINLTVPPSWRIERAAGKVVMLAPEAGSYMAVLDAAAADPEAAVAEAWAALGQTAATPPAAGKDEPGHNGWTRTRRYTLPAAPGAAARTVQAQALQSDGRWTVLVMDIADDVADKREAQIRGLLDSLRPAHFRAETFAGKPAKHLDQSDLDALRRFIQDARTRLDIPGIAIGVVQDGRVVLAEGFGVRALGSDAPVDADTGFMIASSTKSLTTLLLAKLVDEGRFDWETPVTDVYPAFRLGDDATTRRVRMKHLVCACTGVPRQDMEFLLEGERITPTSTFTDLADTQPTSGFGELFQYSNALAAASGYIAGHALWPRRDPGAAYDAAMQARVFGPLGMRHTTFDYAKAQRRNHAQPHGQGLDGRTVRLDMGINHSPIGMRPAGAAWSTVNDLLRYVQMETQDGVLPNGRRYIGKPALHERRAPQVSMGRDAAYGMGLMIDRTSGTPVIHHGGDLFGYHGDMFWLADHGVGAVLLTNADSGVFLRGPFRRRLMELLFDGAPEAEGRVTAQAQKLAEGAAAQRSAMGWPAETALAERLAPRYHNDDLGTIDVSQGDGHLWFDFGAWRSAMASRRQDDGRVVFVSGSPGVSGIFEFEMGNEASRPTLTLRHGQNVYRFEANEG